MITLVVAYDEARVMGNKGGIPWHIPEDFKHFKHTTIGHSCIMGRKTWDSLPPKFKPLPDRMNIVVTRNDVVLENEWSVKELPKNTCAPHFESSLESAIELAKEFDDEIFIIGGSEIYKQALEKQLVDRVLASEVKGVHEGDTFFPDLPLEGLELVKARKVLQEFDDFNIVEYIL